MLTGREFKEDTHAAGSVKVQKNSLKVTSTVKIIPKKSPPVVINEIAVPLDSIDANQVNMKIEKVDNLTEVQTHNQTPRDLWKSKEIREDKKESKTYDEAAKYHWRQNIAPTRSNRDYLDVSNENFTNYKTVDVEGNEVTPSTYNIFRDSMKKTFTQMRDTLKDNLPELNPEETTESDDNEEVVPLDFRTKLLDSNGDIVMQAKPLRLYGSDDDDGESISEILKKSKDHEERKFLQMSSEDYLTQNRKEAFNDDDENVILIQPNTNIREKLEAIEFDCTRYTYLNNAIDAPKAKAKPPKINKNFRQDDEDLKNMQKLNQLSRRKKAAESRAEEQAQLQEEHVSSDEAPVEPNVEMLDFDNILKSQGIELDDILDGNEHQPSQEPMVFNKDTIMQLLSMNGLSAVDGQIVEDKKEEEQEADHNSTSENETAPMSALIDDYKSEEETKKEQLSDAQKKDMAFKRSLVDASSASEDERGFKHNKNVGLSSDEELIDTTVPKQKSMLSGQAILAPKDYSNGKTASTGVTSSSANNDLFIQMPGMNKGKPSSYTNRSPPTQYGPDSLLFKKNEDAPSNLSSGRPDTATSRPTKINYRGVWIEADPDGEGDDDSDRRANEKHEFDTQRELMKRKIKKDKNNEFGEIDRLKMENVGVEIVDKERLVKVDRDWGQSMTGFDQHVGKQYAEDH